MFRVHAGQVSALREAAREGYVDRVLAHARRVLPEVAGMGDGELRGRVESGLARAAERGVVTELDACVYVDVSLLVGEGFEALAWAAPLVEALVERQEGAREELLARALAAGHG